MDIVYKYIPQDKHFIGMFITSPMPDESFLIFIGNIVSNGRTTAQKSCSLSENRATRNPSHGKFGHLVTEQKGAQIQVKVEEVQREKPAKREKQARCGARRFSTPLEQ